MKKLIIVTLCLLLLAGCAAPAVYDGPTESAWVLTEQATTFYNPVTGKTQTMVWNYSYDGFGNAVQTHTYTDGEPEVEMVDTYDDRGNLTREVTRQQFWFFSYPISRTERTYDGQNRPLTITYRSGLGAKTGSVTYTYDDEAGTVTSESPIETQTKYLGENGEILRIVTLSNGAEIETVYEYDELGRDIRSTRYDDGVLAAIHETSYDDQGRGLESTFRDAGGEILTHITYLYEGNTVTTRDEAGNWSKETLRPDGQVETWENYGADGKLLSRTEYTYTEIQVPAKEE